MPSFKKTLTHCGALLYLLTYIVAALYTTPPPTCDDNLSNCASYGVASCSGAYMGWAQENCKRYCGYCGE